MSTTALIVRVIAPICVFVVFILLTFAVPRGATLRSSRRLRALVAYVVFVSMFAGVMGRDLWPFATWRFAAYDIGDSGHLLRVVGVDGNGREQTLDGRALEPLEGGGLIDDGVGRVSEEVMRERMRFLLQLAQTNLARAHHAHGIGTFSRVLGPFTAPIFQAIDESWSNPADRPATLTDLRVYRLYWRVQDGVLRIERRELVAAARP